MNTKEIAGQTQQRPPNIAPNPTLPGQYRSPYPYGMQPPRTVNVLQAGGYPGLGASNHRTATQVAQQPTFMQQRGAFGFQQQPNGTSTNNTSLPPHLQSQTPNPPSVSSTSELGLDPNDFPALGSTSAANNNNNGNGNNNGSVTSSVTTSYASQAGTGMGGAGSTPAIGGTGAGGSSSQTRDFTPDDFPALGANANQDNNNHSHPPPPGLVNGFDQQHRQNLLGTLQGTPGMLNLGPQQVRTGSGGVGVGFESEKQQQQRKLYQSAHAAWNSPNTPSAQAQPSAAAFSTTNGTHPLPPSTTQHLSAPPNLPPPPLHQIGGNNGNGNGTGVAVSPAAAVAYGSNGLAGGAEPNPSGPSPNANPNPNATPNPHPNSTQNSLPNSTAHVHQHPQTPAQQILMSAADRWGLLGLLAMIKNAGSDADQGLSSVGTDLGTMGLDMGYAG